LPGVGGRGVSGGESGGAGIDVPSVREKLMGVSVNGLYLPPAMVKGGCVVDSVESVGQMRGNAARAGSMGGRGLCNSDWRSVAKAANRRELRRCPGAKGSTRLRVSRDHFSARHEANEARRRVENVADGSATAQPTACSQLIPGLPRCHNKRAAQRARAHEIKNCSRNAVATPPTVSGEPHQEAAVRLPSQVQDTATCIGQVPLFAVYLIIRRR
jgi:hypothetical protein